MNRTFLFLCCSTLTHTNTVRAQSPDSIDVQDGNSDEVISDTQRVYNYPTMMGRYSLPNPSARQFSEFGQIYRIDENNSILDNSTSILLGSSSQKGLLEIEEHSGSVVREFPSEGNVIGAPLFIENMFFFGDSAGWLYAYRYQDGELIWKKKLSAAVVSSITGDTKNALKNGAIYIATTDDAVYALKPSDATLLWRFQHNLDPSMIGDIPIKGQPSPVLTNGLIGCGFSDGAFVLIDVKSGQEKQKSYIGQGRYPDVIATPIYNRKNKIWIVSTFDGPTVALDAQLQFKWEIDVPVSSNVLIENDILYIPSSNGSLSAVEVQNGVKLWEWDSEEGGGLTTPVAIENLLWVNSRDGHFYLLDRDTGKLIYTYKPLYHPSGFQNPPHVTKINTSKDANIAQKSYYNILQLSNQGHIYQFSLQSDPK